MRRGVREGTEECEGLLLFPAGRAAIIEVRRLIAFREFRNRSPLVQIGA